MASTNIIRSVNYGSFGKLIPISNSFITKGCLIWCQYNGVDINDKHPFVFVSDVKKDRVYGFNVNYEPQVFEMMVKAKSKEIVKLVDSELKQLLELRKIIAPTQQDLELIKRDIYQQLPKSVKSQFIFPSQFESHKEILRNYLVKHIKNTKAFFVNPYL